MVQLSRSIVWPACGPDFGSMTSPQIQYAKALLKEVSGTTSNEGWDELQQLLNADEYLKANGGGSDYGSVIIISHSSVHRQPPELSRSSMAGTTRPLPTRIKTVCLQALHHRFVGSSHLPPLHGMAQRTSRSSRKKMPYPPCLPASQRMSSQPPG